MAFHAIPPFRARPRLPAAALVVVFAAAFVAAPPAVAQQREGNAPRNAPRSLLPDDLGAPPAPKVIAPQELPFRNRAKRPPSAPGAAPGTTAGTPPGAASGAPSGTLPDMPDADAEAAAEAARLAQEQAAKEQAQNPLNALSGPTMAPEDAGLLTPATTGYRDNLFEGSDARFLAALLDRIDRPLASRWMQILLQRALLSKTAAPKGLDAADWVAARARALLAMGDGSDAHRLVSAIAINRYTKKLDDAALRTALATADPLALCPVSPAARARNGSPTWELVDAMCLSILGDDVTAAARFDALRQHQTLAAFDIGLAENIASDTGSAQRGSTPDWSDIDRLTPWRLGLAAAAGIAIPAKLVEEASPAEKIWMVRLPGLAISERAQFAALAAATGAISSAEIDRILAAVADAAEPAADSPAALLRRANIAPDIADRLAALQRLLGLAPAGSPERYGWSVAAARAAARIPVEDGAVNSAAELAASLLAAGMVDEARLWWGKAEHASASDRAALWAELVAAVPAVPVEEPFFTSFAKKAPLHRARLLAAGLLGLGRGAVGERPQALDNPWTNALDRAVAEKRAGEVIVLAAIGLQDNWAEVPPDYLRRIAAALSAVGFAPEARLIVAEAAARG